MKMKMMSVLAALVFVLAVGTCVLAFDDEQVPVFVDIAHYVEAYVPVEGIFLEIDFADDLGFDTRVAYEEITVKTNHDIKITMSSRGFEDENQILNQLIRYYYPGELRTPRSSNSFWAGQRDGRGVEFPWSAEGQAGRTTDGLIKFNLEVWFDRWADPSDKKAEDLWHLIRSGEYSDVVTMTIEGV